LTDQESSNEIGSSHFAGRVLPVENSLTATEAVRDFSGLLNTTRLRGESYVIKRGGKPVACIGPVKEAKSKRALRESATDLDSAFHDRLRPLTAECFP
jgi:antitoxin (DNA-binding transcriptional repressor) of toxin-antitoxin stability system